jgi:hypothetical protein
MAAVKKTGVRTLHPSYEKFAAKWKRCRDAMCGQDAVHNAGIAYLPKLKEQTTESYNAYIMRAGWYNASWRTVAGLNGMMFRKPPKQKTATVVEPYLENIDLQGNDFDHFAKDVACDVLEVGRIGLLVDHPPALKLDDGTDPTIGDVEAAGLRPTIQVYEAETIINWKFRNVKNATVLSMVVLTEQHNQPDPKNEFGEITETRYRVLDLDAANVYRVRVFRIDKNDNDEQVGSDVYPLMNGKALDFIPFVFIGPDGTAAKLEEPPLIDLVDLNFAHYRVTAGYEHGCHFTGLPTPWISGYSPPAVAAGQQAEKLYIGSESAMVFPDVGAKAGYLEFTGQGMQCLRDNLDAKKQEMATLGARMLADSSERQVETFGATAIKHVAENSILASIAISVSSGLRIALGWFQQWAGSNDKPEYEINRDFMPVQMDAPTLTALMAAWQGGALSEPELFDLLKRGDLIEAEKTLEDHQGEIDAAPPPAPANATPGALGTQTEEEKAALAVQTAHAMPQKPVKKAA